MPPLQSREADTSQDIVGKQERRQVPGKDQGPGENQKCPLPQEEQEHRGVAEDFPREEGAEHFAVGHRI